MPRLNLTQRAIAKLPAPHPDGKQTLYWDEELRGFGVQCSGKTNQKLFIAQRDVGGRTRRILAETGERIVGCESAADALVHHGQAVCEKYPADVLTHHQRWV